MKKYKDTSKSLLLFLIIILILGISGIIYFLIQIFGTAYILR